MPVVNPNINSMCLICGAKLSEGAITWQSEFLGGIKARVCQNRHKCSVRAAQEMQSIKALQAEVAAMLEEGVHA